MKNTRTKPIEITIVEGNKPVQRKKYVPDKLTDGLEYSEIFVDGKLYKTRKKNRIQ